MTDKIIFWLDAFLMNFCLAVDLQKKHDSEFFAIFDITNRTKNFFENQNIVKFQKQWFLHDHIEINNSKPDTKYLEDFEKRYSINIWELGLNERIFYNHNDFYKFSHDEILSILEKECKLYENILDETKPDFLITSETALHHQHLFYEICKKRGVKILMLHQSKLAYKCTISQELHKIDFMPNLDQIISKNRSFDELLSKLKSFDSGKQTKFYADSFGKSKSSKLKALFEYVFNSDNSNIDTHFSYFGRSKSRVIRKYFMYAIQTKLRKSFIDKNFESKIHSNEKFILFTLNQEPERSTLIATPYYTNQIEVIRHVAKSLPPGYKLYVKEHFSQILREWRKISYYKEILDIPNVRLYHPSADIEKLIQNSSLVISIGGTTPFQAPFYQKPSIIVADLGYAVLPSVIKLKSLEELPITIRNSLNLKVNSDDLDRYFSILEKNSFDFNFKEYEILEGNFFRHGGNFHDTIITNEKMQSFLEINESFFKILSEEHIKKIQQFRELENSSK
tara:strand:- start:164 stop:1684 length:1521 start_codon:yes stop_codon:yes gene_type:complete